MAEATPFFSVASSKGGKLIPLDQDSYSEEEKVLRYEEWSKPEEEIESGLTVVVPGEWMTSEELKNNKNNKEVQIIG